MAAQARTRGVTATIRNAARDHAAAELLRCWATKWPIACVTALSAMFLVRKPGRAWPPNVSAPTIRPAMPETPRKMAFRGVDVAGVVSCMGVIVSILVGSRLCRKVEPRGSAAGAVKAVFGGVERTGMSLRTLSAALTVIVTGASVALGGSPARAASLVDLVVRAATLMQTDADSQTVPVGAEVVELWSEPDDADAERLAVEVTRTNGRVAFRFAIPGPTQVFATYGALSVRRAISVRA